MVTPRVDVLCSRADAGGAEQGAAHKGSNFSPTKCHLLFLLVFVSTTAIKTISSR